MSDGKESQWVNIEEQVVVPEFVQKQQELLSKLKEALEQTVLQEQKKLAAIKEKLQRMQRGGGR